LLLLNVHYNVHQFRAQPHFVDLAVCWAMREEGARAGGVGGVVRCDRPSLALARASVGNDAFTGATQKANRQLDMLISVLPNFDAKLKLYRRLQHHVDEKCFTPTPMEDCACLCVTALLIVLLRPGWRAASPCFVSRCIHYIAWALHSLLAAVGCLAGGRPRCPCRVRSFSTCVSVCARTHARASFAGGRYRDNACCLSCVAEVRDATAAIATAAIAAATAEPKLRSPARLPGLPAADCCCCCCCSRFFDDADAEQTNEGGACTNHHQRLRSDGRCGGMHPRHVSTINDALTRSRSLFVLVAGCGDSDGRGPSFAGGG
jgi:hypothetical protein